MSGPDGIQSHAARRSSCRHFVPAVSVRWLPPHLMPLELQTVEELASKASLMLRFEWRAVLSVSQRLSQSAWCRTDSRASRLSPRQCLVNKLNDVRGGMAGSRLQCQREDKAVSASGNHHRCGGIRDVITRLEAALLLWVIKSVSAFDVVTQHERSSSTDVATRGHCIPELMIIFEFDGIGKSARTKPTARAKRGLCGQCAAGWKTPSRSWPRPGAAEGLGDWRVGLRQSDTRVGPGIVGHNQGM